MTDASPEPTVSDTETAAAQVGAPVNVTALFAEAAAKSGLLWIDVPGDRAWPAWHVWDDGRVIVVSGPGEQHLPWLPPQVRLILRSKDTGGRLLVVSGQVVHLAPGTPEWEAAVALLKPERLNAPPDVEQRWASEATIHSIAPFGAAIEAPGTLTAGSGRMPVHPAPPTTAGWRPWHLRGRPQRRKRQPDPNG
ncbi:MAG: hypothetical protein ABI131_03335 [Nostocoides sp.]